MLTHLVIHRLAVLEHLELSFKSGMSVFTGETGAGKSILIDALGLTLGERAESSLIRPGHTSAEVSAFYDVSNLPAVQQFLRAQGLTQADEIIHECIIRRTLTDEGRSRAFINGHAVPVQQLKALGEHLITLHSQHQHHALLKPIYQLALLDAYANHPELLSLVATEYRRFQTLEKEYQNLLSLQGHTEKLTLLEYQLQELEELNLGPQELLALEAEHKQLSHAEHWALECEAILNAIEQDPENETQREKQTGVLGLLHQSMAKLKTLAINAVQLKNCLELFNSATIALDEALSELTNFKENISSDPNRLTFVDERLGRIFNLARKHRVAPEALFTHKQALTEEAQKLKHLETNLQLLKQSLTEQQQTYRQAAIALSNSRHKASQILIQRILERIRHLDMPHGQFDIRLTVTENMGELGCDDIEFMVSLNPGHPLAPLRKIASGGELSRLSLAIQVITAEKMTIPTLIFDEVDVGVSGKTAEIVGKLLRDLGGRTQVLCVTHLPQVAAQGHHHYKVEKLQTDNTTRTDIQQLNDKEKITEVARLLGGINITKNTIKYAKEMLETV